jgi:hypothetical protein
MEEVLMKKIVAVTTFSLTLIFACLNVAAQIQSREELLKEIQAKRAELMTLEKSFLDPSDSDREANEAFLAGVDTGMIRLLPRDKYDGDALRDPGRKVLSMRGGGAYYSFARSTHEYGYGSDISLESGMLSVGFAGADYGMLLNVGDVPLDRVSESPAVRALLEYTPPVQEAKVRLEHQRLYEGIDLSGFTFKSRLSARVSNTYLLRSISVERSDIAIAFRVVRQEADGSIILLFKVLKRFPTPDFERTKTAARENN